MTTKNKKILAKEIILFFSTLFLGLLFLIGCISYNFFQRNKVSDFDRQRNIVIMSIDSLQITKRTILDDNSIYKFLKKNNLTDKTENEFLTVYQNSDSAKLIYNFMLQNKLTELNETMFYKKYLAKVDIDKYFKILEQTKIGQTQLDLITTKKNIANGKVLTQNQIKTNLLWLFTIAFGIAYVLRPLLKLLRWSFRALRD